ncbi:MAG: hypothetical protein QNJ78_10035 [Gammaproteobacteria bacterium]|nr:hypothetical protein [Gammaproteobacteria bacterium]
MRIHLYLLLIVISSYSPPQTANSAASVLMSQAMLSMMDAMGNLAHDYKRNKGWSSGYPTPPYGSWQGMDYSPWALYGQSGGGIPGQSQLMGPINQAPGVMQGITGNIQPPHLAPPQTPLDGIWQGQGGEMVLVMYGHFRIYASADAYRDGRYTVGEERITLYDPQTGAQRSYEYALSEGRLVFRDREGRLLLFRQLPIPIPPYALFSGRQPQSTEPQTNADQQKEETE